MTTLLGIFPTLIEYFHFSLRVRKLLGKLKNEHWRSYDLFKVVIRNCVGTYYIVPDGWYGDDGSALVKS